tara:strand:- start:211 stop:834 length:624 start_codon:yes stop_codon:yes gene_type:complete
MTYLVSILIPTLIERRQVFSDMIDKLYKQIESGNYQKKIEILYICDDRSVKLCDKRNMLQKLSKGKYFLHLDDDDELDDYFCQSVIEHIEKDLPVYQTKDPDCIGYNQLARVSGKRFIVIPHIQHDFNLNPAPDKNGYPAYYRYPWQYCLWNEKYKKIYRTESDGGNAREDQNWLKKVLLEYPKNMSYIDRVLHYYNFDDPSKSTCQ